MTRLPTPAVVLVVAAFAVYSYASAAAGQDRPRRTMGGGFPLTDSVTSMWGSVDELAEPGKRPLTFMIYFRGRDGWHERKWTSNQQLHGDPFYIEFTSDLVTLRAEFDRSNRRLMVFGREVDLAQNNVVLVENVDQGGNEDVIPLGLVDLNTPEDENPAVWVLQRNQSIRLRVLSSSR